jgi:hypothetical protein
MGIEPSSLIPRPKAVGATSKPFFHFHLLAIVTMITRRNYFDRSRFAWPSTSRTEQPRYKLAHACLSPTLFPRRIPTTNTRPATLHTANLAALASLSYSTIQQCLAGLPLPRAVMMR